LVVLTSSSAIGEHDEAFVAQALPCRLFQQMGAGGLVGARAVIGALRRGIDEGHAEERDFRTLLQRLVQRGQGKHGDQDQHE
jgi:hypothetical protein